MVHAVHCTDSCEAEMMHTWHLASTKYYYDMVVEVMKKMKNERSRADPCLFSSGITCGG